MPESPTQSIDPGFMRAAPAPGQQGRRRRRTLGICVHCHKPVEVGSMHVRLHRRAWHLDCALAADPTTEHPPPD